MLAVSQLVQLVNPSSLKGDSNEKRKAPSGRGGGASMKGNISLSSQLLTFLSPSRLQRRTSKRDDKLYIEPPDSDGCRRITDVARYCQQQIADYDTVCDNIVSQLQGLNESKIETLLLNSLDHFLDVAGFFNDRKGSFSNSEHFRNRITDGFGSLSVVRDLVLTPNAVRLQALHECFIDFFPPIPSAVSGSSSSALSSKVPFVFNLDNTRKMLLGGNGIQGYSGRSYPMDVEAFNSKKTQRFAGMTKEITDLFKEFKTKKSKFVWEQNGVEFLSKSFFKGLIDGYPAVGIVWLDATTSQLALEEVKSLNEGRRVTLDNIEPGIDAHISLRPNNAQSEKSQSIDYMFVAAALPLLKSKGSESKVFSLANGGSSSDGGSIGPGGSRKRQKR